MRRRPLDQGPPQAGRCAQQDRAEGRTHARLVSGHRHLPLAERVREEVPPQRVDRVAGPIQQQQHVEPDDERETDDKRRSLGPAVTPEVGGHDHAETEDPRFGAGHARQPKRRTASKALLPRPCQDAGQAQRDPERLEHAGRVVHDAGRQQARRKRRRHRGGRAPIVAADMKEQDDRGDAESRAHESVENDVDGAGDVEHSDHQQRVQHAPEVVEALQVPKARPAWRGQADLFRQVRDLPVVPDVGVEAVAGILRVGEHEQVQQPRRGGHRGDGRAPRPVQRVRFRLRLLGRNRVR